jgi:hypothetical protein
MRYPTAVGLWRLATVAALAIILEAAMLHLLEQQQVAQLQSELAEHQAVAIQARKRADELSSALAKSNAELDQLRNSDRVAFEQISEGTDNLYAAKENYLDFLRRFPKSSYEAAAREQLAHIEKMIQDHEAEERAVIKAAEKAPDADQALTILEQFAGGPMGPSETLTKAMEKYRKEAEPLRAAREAEKQLGIRIDDVKGSWRESYGEGGGVLLPEVQFRITNTRQSSIKDLTLAAKFYRSGTSSSLGGETTFRIASPFDALGFEPGQSQSVWLHADTGFKSEMFDTIREVGRLGVLPGGGRDFVERWKVDVRIYAVSTGVEPALVRQVTIEGPLLQ